MSTLFESPSSTTERTITLKSARDASLTVAALEHRADALEKLAKKNTEEGYTREARTQLSDAGAITAVILPAFRAQQELPLVDVEQTRAGIREALRGIVRDRLVLHVTDKQLQTPGKQEELLTSREDVVLEELARRIHPYAMAIAESAYRAGYSARANDPEVLAHAELAVLYAGE